MSARPTVFVLMPFDEAYTDVYGDLIKAPLESIGFDVGRADSLFNQQQILKDVVKGIADAALVVADVTDLNENVLYELGLAHALGKRTIMITQRLEELPFDLRPYRANEYSTQFNRAHELTALMKEVGSAVLNGTAEFSNPVQDFAPYALSATSQVSGHTTSEVVSSTAGAGEGGLNNNHDRGGPTEEEDDEEPGLLEQMIALQRGSETTAEVSEQIAALTSGIGEKIAKHTEKLNRATSNLGDRAAGAQLAISRDVARDLDEYSDGVVQLTSRLRQGLVEVAGGANTLARHGQINDDGDARATEGLIESIAGAEREMALGRVSIEQFAQVMLSMPNMDRVLTRATRRTGRAVTGTAEEIQNAESEFARARGLLGERLEAFRRSQA